MVKDFMHEWAWRGVTLFALTCVAAALFILPLLTDVTPLVDDRTVKLVPATGIQGFKVEEFCNDPLTKVTFYPVPDSSGSTYQLLRVKQGMTESVTVVQNAQNEIVVATHYHDGPTGQVAQPAYVSDKAFDCIEAKVGR